MRFSRSHAQISSGHRTRRALSRRVIEQHARPGAGQGPNCSWRSAPYPVSSPASRRPNSQARCPQGAARTSRRSPIGSRPCRPGRFPKLIEIARAAAESDPEAEFRAGLRIILAGLEARL
ncbi:TetR/AcrR family transcriptional regulator C-terminal domain-containing protein [Nocardia asiatica]|uniref:TetR/AcrR family transcriptional regulator C-terminal domain-containing protein n=1 Tax=Nocardia asiatica TaxID=209252 RepID=UPI003CC7CEC5